MPKIDVDKQFEDEGLGDPIVITIEGSDITVPKMTRSRFAALSEMEEGIKSDEGEITAQDSDSVIKYASLLLGMDEEQLQDFDFFKLVAAVKAVTAEMKKAGDLFTVETEEGKNGSGGGDE
jgi:hypothetical protein